MVGIQSDCPKWYKSSSAKNCLLPEYDRIIAHILKIISLKYHFITIIRGLNTIPFINSGVGVTHNSNNYQFEIIIFFVWHSHLGTQPEELREVSASSAQPSSSSEVIFFMDFSNSSPVISAFWKPMMMLEWMRFVGRLFSEEPEINLKYSKQVTC